MAAGLPGFGLSGAFFVVSALLMLPIEIVHTLRGRSCLARWISVLRNAAIALAILAGIELTYVALHFAAAELSGSASLDGVGTIPVLPFLGTLGLVALVAASGKAAEMFTALRRSATTQHADPGAIGDRQLAHRQPKDVPGSRPAHGQTQPHAVQSERLVHPVPATAQAR